MGFLCNSFNGHLYLSLLPIPLFYHPQQDTHDPEGKGMTCKSDASGGDYDFTDPA